MPHFNDIKNLCATEKIMNYELRIMNYLLSLH